MSDRAARILEEFIRSHGYLLEVVDPSVARNQWQLSSLPGGANNRVMRADSPKRSYVVKNYFTALGDTRDRLRTEWSFIRFAWDCGVRLVPEPIACFSDRRVAVYEFIPGRKLAPGEVAQRHVVEALDFLMEINAYREAAAAVPLANVSEGCFSILQHVDRVRQRVEELKQIAVRDASTIVRTFIEEELAERWTVIEQMIEGQAKKLHAVADLVPHHERIVSPSDFGFHNAIVATTGQLRFFDFEYAGWDDAAKTICDFFCQPAVPVPLEHMPWFVERLCELSGDSVRERVRLLFPLYRLKWACIVLNPMTRLGRGRRQFSQMAGRVDTMNEELLIERARRFLEEEE